ncbi:2OG-Fe(II) oxygenase [Glycomyces sp. TRM65418]|uniref:2OG-Fe(II) oxygenase n=1 Tax=Glycomyces sp. TRM65418 TaxID=2867006 RepID=UPI001CE524F8|nr:2OG-Fe(II) oxygenase [Glycomyces sp. TRM65418]MCC3765509.1 2OG-Fe(II) oxygenase [Glycomyces sp. TRM65418]QZD55116.1 2OG-Fe(II) oxygenase [Glycomyces sp. TRM65418]
MNRQITSVGDRFVVFDDFFDDDELRFAREWATSISVEMRDSVIDATDGKAWRSSTVGFATDADDAPVHLRTVFQAFAMPEVPWAAEESSMVTGAVWRYPRGSALGWHNDAGGGRIGEFVCFLHPEWGGDWGGELVVLDKAADQSDRTGPDGTLSIPEFVSRSRSTMTLIAPVPNRVVFLRAGTAHTIKRVEDQWQAEPRLTFTGFVTNKAQSNQGRARRLLQALVSEG